MAEQLQLRRGTNAEILAFLGAQGEVVVDTTNNRAVVQDGSTTGGFPAAKLIEVVLNSTATNITAHSGGGQASAVELVATINRITTVAAANDSVKLAPSGPTNVVQIVINDGTNSAQVYGTGSDTINGAAAATGVALAAGKIGIYFSPATGIWRGGTLN
ncbi:hypothetical protein CWB41_14075 [Methylovirgula ligni]|uniref:Major tropism determinant N-terminal domain-containing protein n=1 Tax=Methylovirgula ligni TaxID=569860 RepID=A0A3D9YMN9_9HYPH|nr:hypothetical protein [Methylovirgula ligni]QAY96721.1 hypothetical protein CWB41_14075 [Methylovirgula ligni]REF83238.1 hypothetical protein DES32_3154 [Methylovirgula ligni]